MRLDHNLATAARQREDDDDDDDCPDIDSAGIFGNLQESSAFGRLFP